MRFTRVLIPSIAVLFATLPSIAQQPPDAPGQPPPPPPPGERGPSGPGRPGFGPGGGMRPMLEPTKAKAAWTLEAQTASRRTGLEEAQTAKTVELYIAARGQHRAATEEIRSKLREKMEEAQAGSDEPRGDWREIGAELQKQIGDLQKSQREQLTTKLTEVLGAEQAGKVAASLGSFNPNWDFMVDALVGFNLEPAKLNKALGLTESYIIAADHARGSAGDDPGAMRTAMQEARANLADALEPILTPEQMDNFRRTINPGRGPGPGMRDAPGDRGPGPGGKAPE